MNRRTWRTVNGGRQPLVGNRGLIAESRKLITVSFITHKIIPLRF
ncbi:hypothetical protein AVDCRST_MAG94-1545 [uncultured Leptolyngbya sp.]|uniref:Uncharacterized protein n=1 Tax=uncultured Leptolyngbya sp. TaxID=332963 RepID=A0A6J4L5X2_9CYAN|nr:hypothetical protein AVDCRST_MAG94-1545 [uncultured Leptolyngbya sp.]